MNPDTDSLDYTQTEPEAIEEKPEEEKEKAKEKTVSARLILSNEQVNNHNYILWKPLVFRGLHTNMYYTKQTEIYRCRYNMNN